MKVNEKLVDENGAPVPASAVVEAKPAKATDPEEIKVGDRMRLRAVYGVIIDPTAPVTTFQLGGNPKVTVNEWMAMQYDHGKLAIEADD